MNKNLIKDLKKTGFDVKTGCLSIGFALTDIGRNQIAFTCIHAINLWENKNFGTNLNIFFEENALQCLEPKCARFHLKDSSIFDGHLIATNLRTVLSLRNVHRCRKYFYINDLSWLNHDEIDSFMKDDKIVKFCRCQDYRDELRKKGYKINDIIIEDFDITKILELINAESK